MGGTTPGPKSAVSPPISSWVKFVTSVTQGPTDLMYFISVDLCLDRSSDNLELDTSVELRFVRSFLNLELFKSVDLTLALSSVNLESVRSAYLSLGRSSEIIESVSVLYFFTLVDEALKFLGVS